MGHRLHLSFDAAALADISPTQRKAEEQGESTQGSVSGMPTGMCDNTLRDNWESHGSQTRAHHHEGECSAQSPVKPGGDRSRIGQMRGAVSYRTQQEAG